MNEPKLRQSMAELEGLIEEMKLGKRRKNMPKKHRTNPFEYLRISPDVDTQEVVEQGRELSFDASPEEKLHIRQAVLEITTHPLKRLEYEVFTYYGAEYEDNNWTEPKKEFLWQLTSFLRGKEHQYELEYGLLRNFHNIISSHPQVDRLHSVLLSSNKSAAEQYWKEIFKDNTNNHWFIHTLALLHQEWAEEYEGQRDLELASFHWQESRKHWFRLYPKEEFWDYFEDNNPELKSDQFSTFVEGFPKRLLEIHQNRLQESLHQRKQTLAQIHFNCLKLAQEIKDSRINLPANELIENLTSKYLQEAKEKLEPHEKKLPEGIREDYEPAINHIKALLELDPNNKRALQFVVEQYNNWGFDLYTQDDKSGLSKLVEKAKPFTKKLANQTTKGQGFCRENQIVATNLLMQGYACDDSRKSIALFREALEYNPDFDNAKELLKEAEGQLLYEKILPYEKALGQAQKAWEKGDDDEVINSLKTIPSSFDGYEEIKKFLATAYNRRGVNKANKLLTSTPSDLSDILRIKNGLESAVNDLTTALQNDPYNQQIKDNLNGVKNNLDAIKKAQDMVSSGRYSYTTHSPSRRDSSTPGWLKVIWNIVGWIVFWLLINFVMRLFGR